MSEKTPEFKVLLLWQLMNENQFLISNGKTLRFGMAREIAAHAPFGKSSSALKGKFER